jgi:NAD+ diphosphatase
MHDWRTCPRCGHSLDSHESGRDSHVSCPNCGFVHYQNPIPTTIGIVVHEGRLLLLRRAHEPMAGSWDAIGGFVNVGESAEDCLVREAREELGCGIDGLRFLGTYPSVYGTAPRQTIGIAFRCELEPGARITLSAENSDYGWYRPSDLPQLGFPDVRRAVADVAGELGAG